MAATTANPTAVDMDTLSPIMSRASSYYRMGTDAARPHPVVTTSSRRSSASSAPTALRPSLTRRTSLEEDYFYREVFTVERKPNEPPPSYEATIKKIQRKEREVAAAAERKKADLDNIRKKAAAVTASSKSKDKGKDKGKGKANGKGKEKAPIDSLVTEIQSLAPEDVLPPYSCDIHIEGVFLKKMEIENTTKRAEDRRWNTEYVVLHGTSLEVYEARKDRSWAGRTAKSGPGVCPDRPPWMRKAALEKRYSLLYADVGIAADYAKRRYVIRIRAETDQFLISCVELETFVQWLDALFAAISVAAPIDERDFPRDQSIPRVQRVRWYSGNRRDREAEAIVDQERDEDRARESERDSERESENENENEGQGEGADEATPLPTPLSISRSASPTRVRSKPGQARQPPATAAAAVLAAVSDDAPQHRLIRSETGTSQVSAISAAASSSSSSSGSSDATVAGPSTPAPLHHVTAQQRAAARAMQAPGNTPSIMSGSSLGARRGARFSLRTITSRLAQKHRQKAVAFKNSKPNESGSEDENDNGGPSHGPARAAAGIGARSGFSPINHDFVDASTGKWQPRHRWTKTHDMVYARLCYATLLFRSPRKSNYIIVRGKQWLVDWKTGNMARVSPPWYGEVECQPGPWQILHTENARI